MLNYDITYSATKATYAGFYWMTAHVLHSGSLEVLMQNNLNTSFTTANCRSSKWISEETKATLKSHF